MYLKSIEMQGFKSFADRTKLIFHNGVTGIVGPNGSGKSNVADAVRWVLGEQSARQLRGGNMQDVIFAGTETRKPLGFASVAITMDNADRKLNFDADEITVTRKLYRSGESEYLLNGKNCRLKDINELFYDTGIGKEGYSIIGQGQIDKILSGKPEDRRELFDEAAGIVKFKRRKAASLKKLEDEQANLVRVNDILSEVTRQLGPLEKQAKRAEEYLTKRDSLRTMDIQLFQIDEKRTEQELKDLSGKKKIAADHLDSITAEFEKTRQEYDEAEKQLEKLDSDLNEARELLQKAEVEKKQREGQVDVLNEQIKASETNSRLLSDRLNSIDKDRQSREEDLRSETETREALSEKLREARQRKEEKEKAAASLAEEIGRRTDEAEKSRTDTIRLLNDRSSIRERMQRYDTMLEQIGIRKAELNSRMIQMKENETSEREKLEQMQKEFQKISGEVADLQAEIDSGEKKLSGYRDTLTEDSRKMEAGQAEYHREASRLESLRHITEQYEGYGNSVRKVMEQKSRNSGIYGVVADLIRTDEKYETAIETALGGSLQNIVTDNESTAKYLIEYLKKGHYGRATFLPLTAMHGREEPGNPDVLRENGVIGKADQLVEADEMYMGVVRRLLGRTYVTDTIDHAIAVSRRYHQTLRIVTLGGELLSPGGSMTGGSFRYNNNLLGRRREISELTDKVRSLKTENDRLQTEIDSVRQKRNALRDEVSARREKQQAKNIALNTAKVNLNNARERASSIQADYEKLLRERQEIENQVEEITEQRSVIGSELKDSESREEELKAAMERISGETDSLREKEKKAQSEQNEAALSFSNIQQQVSFADEKIRTAKEEIGRLDQERAHVMEDIDKGSGESGIRKEQIEQIRQELDSLTETIRKQRQETERINARKEELNRDHKAFFERRDRLSSQKGDMEQELFRLDAKIEKAQETRDGRISYLYEEYQLTPDKAEAVTFESLPERSALKKDIAGLRSEIKALGNVNVNAVDEYKELKERHDFLSTQHDDLVKAADALKEIIAQLDEGMRKQFRERFAQIRDEFDKVFRELFGGGKGTLELVDEEDILETGINIISQPPGKKLQNMMQLSGGEKALTAISLLFAIQNLKPSPFCLLDEIEAALDDNNVGRFAKYLHKLTKHTQFIVITHRRGTMAAADRLYGITMQEKGVSTLVSVDLIEGSLT